ncbi:MAG TPA: TorF family putative porin [Woeseiaceae bacterium]|nr:TorF family putative porin [Woeseiaceae bacterium]
MAGADAAKRRVRCALARPVLVLLALYCSLINPAVAEGEASGQVTIATDYMFRGVSQTLSGPTIQAEMSLEYNNGWYAFLWASNVDFTDAGAVDDGARVEVDAGIGYALSINDHLTADLSAIVYTFPGTNEGFDYDYLEWQASLSLDEQHQVTVAYSENVFGSAASGTYVSLASGLEIARQLNLGVELGYYNLRNAYGFSYYFAELSVAGTLKSIDWQLSYFATSNGAETLFYESTVNDRLVLTLMLPF